MRSKSFLKSVQKLLSRQVSIRVPKMFDFGSPSDPLGRVLASTSAQFSLFPSGPQKSPKWWPKAPHVNIVWVLECQRRYRYSLSTFFKARALKKGMKTERCKYSQNALHRGLRGRGLDPAKFVT